MKITVIALLVVGVAEALILTQDTTLFLWSVGGLLAGVSGELMISRLSLWSRLRSGQKTAAVSALTFLVYLAVCIVTVRRGDLVAAGLATSAAILYAAAAYTNWSAR